MALGSPVSIPMNKVTALQENVERVIRGKSEIVQIAIAALLARGHILLEDVPGVGKTTLAHALATSISLEFQRLQFTSDLLPADIIGVTIYNQEKREFEFVHGPIFTNVLLADEINRATPKTQSALLEAMSEGTVSLEKQRVILPDPFLVIATQNPIEHVGTYPLPESQLDRFMVKLTLGYPSASDEKLLLRSGGAQSALAALQPVLTQAEFVSLQKSVESIHLSESIVDYVMSLIVATRTSSEVELGVSTRGALTLARLAQAYALVRGRDFVVPDDVKRLAPAVLAHRIILHERRSGAMDFSPQVRFVERTLAAVPVPR
jgi:MoxR-like ATPase